MVYQRNKKAKGDPPHFNNNQKGVTGEIRSTGRSGPATRPACARRLGSKGGASRSVAPVNRLSTRVAPRPIGGGERQPATNRRSAGTTKLGHDPTGLTWQSADRRFVEEKCEVASGNGRILKNTINTPSSTLEGCSVELWEIIVHGYREPQDPIRLTSTEFYNRQLNASARDKIRSGINRKLLDQVNDIESAKELWDRIVVLQEGTDLIQSALYETAKQEAHQFMIREGESMADAYARLGAIRVRVKGLGVEKYNDGFEMNEQFIKSKVIAMIAVKKTPTLHSTYKS
ncbi:hypothetical protein QYE76_015951 [Lolium multiflorum]|uniref:Uncharacterized protein n=1 Tax=Lolium multiflorum TaxID=4521 RepID=A0AAD8U922_LOLMU|nr:hypothetical protein QYE76_015951 [Lolium multiflorum]